MNKQAQMRMMESLMAFIVFSVIFIMGFSFYVNSQQNSINKEVHEITSLNVIDVFSNVLTMPELRCNEFAQKNCLDYYKLIAFKNLEEKSKVEGVPFYYSNKFGHAILTLKVFYPIKYNLTFYNETPKSYQSKLSFFLPVSIYNDTDGFDGSYSLGVVELTVVS